jgi:hypothetical protein
VIHNTLIDPVGLELVQGGLKIPDNGFRRLFVKGDKELTFILENS